MALQDLPDHRVPQAPRVLLEKRARWAPASKDRKATRVIKGSAALPGYLARHKLKKREVLPQQEKRVKRANPVYRAFKGSERKVNPGSPGLGANPGKTARREKGGIRAFKVIRGTQDFQASLVLRERRVKLDLAALLES